VPQKKAAASSSDSDSEESVKLVKKAAAPVKKAAKKDSSSDSDSSDAKPVKKAAPAKKAASKKDSSSSDSDSDVKKADSDNETPAKAEEVAGDEEEEVKDEHDGKLELFVQGLSFDTDENSLREFFGAYGELTKCKLLAAGGVSKGKAFIEFAEHKIARKALNNTNQKDLDGRTIWVEFSGQAAGGYKPQG